MVTPSYMLALLDGFRAAGLDPPKLAEIRSLRREPWTNAMRDEIEAAFDIDATDSTAYPK